MASATQPAIVIAAYERPLELQRLLASLSKAQVPADTTLVISIDGGAACQNDVRAVADRAPWGNGPLQIIEHEHVGLVEHFRRCGDLTAEFGSVVFLEDDLVVGPSFYTWATTALQTAASDDRIAGVSLATPFFDGYQHLPFEPVIDGSDAIFMQVPWYDGMAWTGEMWQHFRSHQVQQSTALHRSFASLGNDEWFPDAVRYLVETSRFYVMPRSAQVTNSGAIGAHFDHETSYFQVPVTLRGPSAFRMQSLDDALSVYDDHMELSADAVKRLVPDLSACNFTVDLLGTRNLADITTPHVLTTRTARHPDRLWGATMHPLIANLVHNVAGDEISLAAIANIDDSEASERRATKVLTTHATRGRQPSVRGSLQQLARSTTDRFRREK